MDKKTKSKLINVLALGAFIIFFPLVGNMQRTFIPTKRQQLEKLADADSSGYLNQREIFKMYNMCGISEEGQPTPITSYELTKEDMEKGIENYKEETYSNN